MLDIGGEPGFLAAALLSRGVPVTVVDSFWRRSGKHNRHTEIEEMKAEMLGAFEKVL